MKNEEALTIGVLAKKSDVGVETVRFYERKGLLPKPQKPTSGFKHYEPEDIKRIKFIKRAQDLGFTLREVKELLKLKVDKKATCGQVMKKTDEKMSEVDQKIKDLQRMKKSLKQIKDCCEDGTQTLTECPILECFETNGGCP
jgi:Hg(II)-responsive transcriptional regulator